MAQPRELEEPIPGMEAMHTTSVIEHQFLSERVKGQIFSFVDLLQAYNSKLPPERQRIPEDYAFLRYFFPAFVADRNSRADEVKSPEYEEVVEQAESLLPMTTLAVMCMDGRVKMIHVFGFSADIGSAIREPGGLLKGFVRGKDGKLKLDQESSFAQQLDEAMRRHKNLAEIFDSHYGCKARKSEEAARGKKPDDDGLYSDVLHKKEMVTATQAYVLEKHGDARHVALVQTTFNPITGYLYMGLETDEAIEFAKSFARKKAVAIGKNPERAIPVYSKEVIKAMIDEGIIISTGALIENEIIRAAFDDHFFDISWKDKYIASAKDLWKGIATMKESLLPVFKRTLISIYPALSSSDRATQRELEERAMLLLTNSFNAYLHNRDHNEPDYLAMSDEAYEEQEHYEYDVHREEGVKISRGGHPVYDIAMLVINSEDKENMAGNLEFASGIVRDNRWVKHIRDASGVYDGPEDFAAAPMPAVMQEIVTDQRLSEKDWEALGKIDWTGLQDLPWDTMTPAQFAKYLEGKGVLPNSIANAIEGLRQNMAQIFNRNAPTSAHLIDQYKVVLPIICDQDRQTHAIIPFVKLGY